MHYVILGNGVAGIEAAIGLRARDDEARITLVSAEHDHFFSRPALMYVFAGQTSLRDTEPHDRRLYERMRFERVSRRVASLDAAGHGLVLEDGSRLAYGKLLVAAGSRGRPAPWPGAEGPGLHYFVTLRDLEALDREARQGMRAAVLGGGLIGVEVAEVLHDRGLHVTFVIREGWYFPVALDRSTCERTVSTCGWGRAWTRWCAGRRAGSARCGSPAVATLRPTSWSRRSVSCPTPASWRVGP
jgi:NAD(P)H-nitrite reductase large subunit